MIHVKNSTQYYINERALTFSENDLDDPNRVAVSLVSGTVILVHVPGTIDFASDGNYERWTLRGYSTKLVKNDAHNIYARLSRTDRTALIVFSVNKYNIDGSITTGNTTDENGNEIPETTDPSTEYFYIKIGEITATDGTSERELTYDSGLLSTAKGDEESDELKLMWELDKYSTPWLIRAKQWLHSFTVKGFITLIGGLIFKSGDTEKAITDIKRSTDSDEEVPVNDETVPTTLQTKEFVEGELEKLDDRFLRKDQSDRTEHSLGIGGNLSVGGVMSSEKAVEIGDFNEGTLGSGAAMYQGADGNTYIESDFLKIRKKATFTNITIQELKHVGGEIILSPAAMVISRVEELVDGWKCFFENADADGRKIYNEFESGDQAMCRTFNLSPNPEDLISNHYYWRLVTEVGEDYIVLSKTDCDTNSDIPMVGDNVSQLGHRADSERQAAIILSAYGPDAPSYKQYNGIDSFSLDGKQVTKLSPYGNELTGKMTVEQGSVGWENFDGLPEELQSAINAANDAQSSIDNLEYGKNNLLRNSGFTGDYATASLGGNTSLNESSQMFSPSLKYWEATDAIAQESEVSESGKEVSILSGGSLQQTMFFKVAANEKYIFSFRGKGQSVTFSVGGYTENIAMTSEWASYASKFTAVFDGQIFSIRVVGDCTLCELQLERGTIKSSWGASSLDNRHELAKYDSLAYLSSLLKATTSIIGGVVNTGYINMGNLGEDGELAETTAGVSGIYNDDSSVAYFAGGNLEKAIYTVATYLDNPNYTPTQEELNRMAKFVVTHGGRAILNDIILRGYIYALGGYFKGEVNAEKGVFKNITSPNNNFQIDSEGNVVFNGGKIGRFVINNGYIGIQTENKELLGFNSLLALMDSCILYNGQDIRAAIGSSVRPASTGVVALGDFTNKKTDYYQPNYGLLFDIANSSHGNFAFSGNGSGVLNGWMCGYGVELVECKANTITIISSMYKGNNFVITSSFSGSAIGLPSVDDVKNSLDIESSVDMNFCIPVHICNGGSSTIKVYGKNDVSSTMNSDDYPVMDGTLSVATGEYVTVMLAYTNGTYRAFSV